MVKNLEDTAISCYIKFRVITNFVMSLFSRIVFKDIFAALKIICDFGRIYISVNNIVITPFLF